MKEVSKMEKKELLQYVQQLQQAQARAQAAAAAAEQRAAQAEAAAAAAKVKRAPAPKTHGELLGSDPAYLAGAIWHHVQWLNLSATEEGALNALVAHALKGGKLMSAGASRQNLSRARRAVTGYLTEKRQAEAHDIVFDCLYCVPALAVTPEGDYMGFDKVLKKSPRLLAESLETANAGTDENAKTEAQAAYDAAAAEFALWLEAQKAQIAAAQAQDKVSNCA